jgi:hypothetical protein
MAESFENNWKNKAYERLKSTRDVMNREDEDNRVDLDKEEVEYGNVDDRNDEIEDYRTFNLFFLLGLKGTLEILWTLTRYFCSYFGCLLSAY